MISRRRGIAGLAIAAAIASALRYAPTIDDPWDRTTGSVNACTYFGRIEQNWQRYGFRELRGEPYLYKMPAVSGLLPPEKESFAYVRHPALAFWLLHATVEAFGWSERTFRVLPIAFSSLAGALLVFLIGRHAGSFWAAGGLVLWLTLPMSWYVGAIVSYEPIVLALMIAAFVVHDRLRHAGLGAWLLTWPVVFLAGLADWIGVAIAPAIFVYEALAPRDERRLGRAGMLIAPAFASIAFHVALVGWWHGSLAEGIAYLRAKAETSAITAMQKGGFGEWLANQGMFWRTMFTLPVAILAAAAVPWLAWRSRRAGDALPRIALALLVPAVLNVALFRGHSFDHDFWWAYGIPFAVLAPVILLRDATARLPAGARAALASAALLGLSLWAVREDFVRYQATKTTEFRDRGRELNRFAGPRDALLSIGDLELSSFYVDAWSPWGGGADSGLEAFEIVATQKKRRFLHVDRVVVLVPDGTNPAFKTENLDRMRAVGSVRHLDAAEFAAECPAVARSFPGSGLWVLTIP